MLDLQRLKVGRGEEMVYILERYLSILLAGKSGTGKSSLLLAWMVIDFLFKQALILIDPSGFLAQRRLFALERQSSLLFFRPPYFG